MSPHVCRRHCHENWINFFASEILENKKGGTTTYVYVLCTVIRRRRKAKVRVGFACEYLARVEKAFGCAVCQYSASAKSTNGSVVSFIGIRELYPVHRLQVYLWLLDHTKLFALWKHICLESNLGHFGSHKIWKQFWVALIKLYLKPLWDMLKSKMSPFFLLDLNTVIWSL